MRGKPSKSIDEIKVRFEQKFDKNENGCWIWSAAATKEVNGGYGMFAVRGGKCIQAHRASYELYKGEIPLFAEIHHSCKNNKCVNPDHLSATSTNLHQMIHTLIKNKSNTIEFVINMLYHFRDDPKINSIIEELKKL